jgi:transposase-like protein
MPRRGHHQEKIIRALKQANAGVNGGESCREHGIRIEETYVRVKGKWRYLYRALDSTGATIDFLLSTNRDAEAARRFLTKALTGTTLPTPRLMNTDKHAGYPPAIVQLQAEGALEENRRHRPGPYHK